MRCRTKGKQNRRKGQSVFLLWLLCGLFLIFPAMADPVTAAEETEISAAGTDGQQAVGPVIAVQEESGTSSAGAGSQKFSAGADYGPGTVNSGFADAVKLETTLLKTDDPVPLYTNQNLGLGGAKVIMIRGTQDAQQLCIIVETSDGKRIVADGGSAENTGYLYRYLCENGGFVDAWLVTHPHQDHVGALTEILSDPAAYPLDIRRIYCSTQVFPYLQTHEDSSRTDFLNRFIAALGYFDQKKLTADMQAGYTFQVGSAGVRVINTPAEFENDTGNNSSVAYRITLGDKSLMLLGDLGYEASVRMTAEHAPDELKADILQLAHHGQHAGCPELYRLIAPSTALWAASEYIWSQVDDPVDTFRDSYTPQVTMSWMRQMGVSRNYSMSYGNWMLQ